MFSRVKDFFSRHRRKFIVSGVLVGGSYLAYRLALKKLRDFQEKQTKDFIEQTRRMNHFESTERTCNQVIIGISSKLYEEIIKLLSSEELLERLRRKPANKVELWNELKVLSFTRLTVFIYASSMLTITLRTQINLLGGYLYKDTLNGKNPNKISETIREKYLSLIQHFLEEGLLSLVELVKSKVSEVMKGQNLTDPLSIADIEQIFWSIQMSINSDQMDPNSKMAAYMLPKEIRDVPSLEQMFNETLDVLESEEVVGLCSNNICRGFSLAVDNIAEYLCVEPTDTAKIVDVSKQLLNINKFDLPLAKLIPIICGVTSKGFDSDSKPQNLATSLVTFYLVNEKVKTLGANIYESFST